MNKMKYHLRPVLFLRNMFFPFFLIFPINRGDGKTERTEREKEYKTILFGL